VSPVEVPATGPPPLAPDVARTLHIPVPPMVRLDQRPALPAEVPAEIRRSWFSRRPLAFVPANWGIEWHERGRRVSRYRTALVVIPLLVALVVAGSYGAHLLYADPAPAAADTDTATCWDGVRAPAADCSLPSGVDGLAWVFPSFDPEGDGCVDVLVAHPEYKRPAMWTCTEPIGTGTVDITYSELTAVSTGLAYHEKLFEGAKLSAFPDEDGTIDRLVWRQPEPVDGIWRMAAMYHDFPYAVLIEAHTLRQRDRTYRDLVRSRDPKHITTRFR